MDDNFGLREDLTCLKGKMEEIVKMLSGKTFDIISFHSKYDNLPRVLESRSLKSEEVIVDGTLIKILLSPSRSLSFDLKDEPKVSFISERQVLILRKMFKNDRLMRLILINRDNK